MLTSRVSSAVVIFLFFSLSLILLPSSQAQQLCANSSPPPPGCVCYPGQTNAPDCNQLACGNLYQNSSARAPFDVSLAGSSGNAGCGQQCTGGFSGSNCNICQSADTCQNAIPAAPLGTPLPTRDVICSSEPIAYTANFGECLIDNPTVKALLPGKLLASIQRYPDPSSASLPTSSGISAVTPGLTTVQLLYAANASAPLQQQFSCQATNCTQSIEKDNYSMHCQTLKCQCSKGSFMCGGGPLDLTTTINTLSGDVGFDCPSMSNTATSIASPCHIQMGLLKNIFGPQGFSLTNCQFGECISKTIAMSKRQELIDGTTKKSTSPGVIAALVVVLFFFLGLIALVIWGFYLQHLARRGKGAGDSGVISAAAAQVEWSNLRYHLPLKSGAASFLRRRRIPPRSPHLHAAAAAASPPPL